MKITAKQFAISLYESVDAKSVGEVKAVIKKFVELLAKKNKIALAEKIIKEFIMIWNEKHGLIEAEITSANELGKETVELLKSYLIKRSVAKKVILDEKIDKNILGGVIIKYGDKILDGSLRQSLAELREQLIK